MYKIIRRVRNAFRKSDWDANIVHGITLRAVFEFCVTVLILFIVGLLVHYKMSELLEEAHDQSLSRHIGRLTYVIENQFRNRIRDLKLNIKLVEQGELTPEGLIHLSQTIKWSSTTGIISAEGEVIAGDNLPKLSFDDLENIFDGGNKVITYHYYGGLMYAVPIEVNGKTCAYWELYEDDKLRRSRQSSFSE